MASILTINGVDFEPFLARDGVVWTRNDVDSSEAGEMADGTVRRDRVIIRPSLQITIENWKVYITNEIVNTILTALDPQWVNVTYHDPRLGKMVTRQFYTNSPSVRVMSTKGKTRWAIEPFTLVAKGVPGDGSSNLE